MYREHFGLRHPPFRITPQTEHFYTGAQRGPLLEALLFAVANDEGIIRVSGEVGTGKTMLCRMLIERLPAETLVIYIANPSLSPAELITTVAHELQVEHEEGHSLLRQIERRLIALYSEGRRVLAIVDEAHAMPRDSLEQVRLLSNLETGTRKLLQIVLFGQPELDAILAERPMRSLRERVTQSFRLAPLDRQQTRDYIDFRLRAAGYRGPELFGNKVLNLIARASRGLTRRINILADKTLLAAFADNTHTVSLRHAQAALRDAGYSCRSRSWWRSGLAILLLIGLGSLAGLAAYLWQRSVTNVISEPAKAESAPSTARQPSEAEAATHVTDSAKQAITATGSSAASTATQAQPPENDLARFAPIPEQLGPLARERLQASRTDMQQISDKQWFIQLRSIPATNASTLENFIPAAAKAIDVNELRLYVVRGDSRQTIGVIYGSYPDAAAAQAGLARLPDWIRAGGAFVRPFRSLR